MEDWKSTGDSLKRLVNKRSNQLSSYTPPHVTSQPLPNWMQQSIYTGCFQNGSEYIISI